jgi:phosphoglucomutase
MQNLIGLKNRFDIAFACDTNHDRRGIVTRNEGLRPPNPKQKQLLARLSSQQVRLTDLAGEKKQTILTRARGNARPSAG